MPGEITPEHLSRKLFIYVRQSSQNQVRNNLESQRLQYNLSKRAQSLGWSEQDIVVLDGDLGITATGVKVRRDYEEIMRQLCLNKAGGIMVLNSSRMARNGREWHQVLEMCPIFKTLIIDSDGIYDPRLPSDKLWLGMKASFSEYEVSQLQTLARSAILSKAQRGKLFHNLPAGLERTPDDDIELHPDKRVQQALYTVFDKFDELGSIRQVFKWCHRERIEIPVRVYNGGVGIAWRIPTYSSLNNLFTNPLYAGFYMYPRTKTVTRLVDGQIVKTSGHRVPRNEIETLIPNLFNGYISSEKYEQNQQIIANNCQMKGTSRGAAREGRSLLAGLILCGHCSRKMRVHYSAGKAVPYYYCAKPNKVANAQSCLRFSGRLLEEFVSRQIIAAVEPIATQAAILTEEKFNQSIRQKSDALYYALQQARYEAERHERQFNATEPENYLVSRTLASRWQQALEKVKELESQHNRLLAEHKPLTEDERTHLLNLAGDLKTLWQDPKLDFKSKSRLVRLLIKEVWVGADEQQTKIKATIHWQGGVHTEFEWPKRGRAEQSDGEIIKEQPDELIKKLAFVCEDGQIARILNRAGIRTKDNRTWSEFEVAECREQNNIACFSQTQYDKRGIVNLMTASEILDLSLASVLELIKCGLIKANQVIKYAPWEIERIELEKPTVLRAVAAMKKGQNIPFHENQQELSI